MAITKMLKIDDTELVLIETLLENFNKTKPHEALLKISNNVLANIQKKKDDYSNHCTRNDDVLEQEKILKKLICGDYSSILGKQVSLCSSCQNDSNDNCLKTENIKNYWGEKDGLEFIKQTKQGSSKDCIYFESKRVFEILDIDSSKGVYCINTKVIQNNESETFFYSVRDINLYIHKYGEASFSNLNEYKEQIKNIENNDL